MDTTLDRQNESALAAIAAFRATQASDSASKRAIQFGQIVSASCPASTLSNPIDGDTEQFRHQADTAAPHYHLSPASSGTDARTAQFKVGYQHKRVVPMRASSVATLLECPARWKAIHLDGLQSKPNTAARFGTSMHAAVAAFDKRRMLGENDRLLEESTAVFHDELARPEEGLVWDEKDYSKAQLIGVDLLKKYVDQIAPRYKFVAVEVKCPPMDILVEGIVLRLTGSVDRIRVAATGGYGVTDFKSGEQAVRADDTVVVAPHRAQVGVYEILSGPMMGVQMSEPAEIIGMQTNGKARVAVGQIHGATEALIGTEDSPGTLVYVARLIREGIYYGNPKSLMCSEKFCPAHPTCKFRK